MTTTSSLYERLGRREGLLAVSLSLWQRMQADPELAPWTADVDLDSVAAKLATFLESVLTGGYDEHSALVLRSVHARMDLTDFHFGRVAQHLTDTLGDAGVPVTDAQEVLVAVGAMRPDVLGLPVTG